MIAHRIDWQRGGSRIAFADSHGAPSHPYAQRSSSRRPTRCAIVALRPRMCRTLRSDKELTLRADSARSLATDVRRPDLGRQLPPDKRERVSAQATAPSDIAIVIADGLSSAAVEANAAPFLGALLPRLREDGLTLSPISIVLEGRVAIGDEIGALLRARMVLVLIGERPGLSAADSLGAYSNHDPRPGRSDAERNCISNIQNEGLNSVAAAGVAHWLIVNTLKRQLSGVRLKDGSTLRSLSLERRLTPQRGIPRAPCRARWALTSKPLKKLAGGPGFEPRLTESEFAVLPLNYPPTAA